MKIFIGLLSFVGLIGCGPKENLNDRGKTLRSNTEDGNLGTRVTIPVAVGSRNPSLALTEAGTLSMQMTSCGSGLSFSNITEDVDSISVYLGDTGCLVKLLRFGVGDTQWVESADDPFTTWLPGDSATFYNEANNSEVKAVQVDQQLSSPIDSSDRVQYSFSESAAGDDAVIAENSISSSHSIGVTGVPAPNFEIAAIDFAGIASAGAGSFTMTLECGVMVAGDLEDSSCDGTMLTAIKYRLVEDTFSNALSLDDAQVLFDGSETAVTASDIIAAGDGGLTKGGFATSLLVGPAPIHSKPHMVLILQASGLSYRYFNIDVTTITP